MINRPIVISTLILATSLAVNWLLGKSESIGDETYRNDPDIYMLNATIAEYNESGELRNIVSSARFTHFPLTDLTTLKNPQIELRPNARWEISANEGRLLSAST